MDFNSILFPAPSEDKYDQMEKHKGKLLFIPKYKNDKTLFHIPCMYQTSHLEQKTNKIFLYFHGNAEDIFNATGNVRVIIDSLPFNTLCMEYPGYSIYYEQKSADIIESDSLELYDFLVNKCKVNNKDILPSRDDSRSAGRRWCCRSCRGRPNPCRRIRSSCLFR